MKKKLTTYSPSLISSHVLEDMLKEAYESGKRVWQHADGHITIATYSEMADYVDRTEDIGWTEIEPI